MARLSKLYRTWTWLAQVASVQHRTIRNQERHQQQDKLPVHSDFGGAKICTQIRSLLDAMHKRQPCRKLCRSMGTELIEGRFSRHTVSPTVINRVHESLGT